ncbi:MAG: hypothetical protein ABJA67_16585 [Chthonomonadales bacterium]
MSTEQAKKSILKSEPNPIVAGLIIVAVVFLVFYGAYRLGFLPVQPPSEFEVRLGQLTRESHGDFGKLKAEDQEYLNQHTSGRGGMAMGEYLKHHKID